MALLHTISIQSKQLEVSTKELEATRQELKASREAQEKSSDSLKTQQFESTFFNMMNLLLTTKSSFDNKVFGNCLYNASVSSSITGQQFSDSKFIPNLRENVCQLEPARASYIDLMIAAICVVGSDNAVTDKPKYYSILSSTLDADGCYLLALFLAYGVEANEVSSKFAIDMINKYGFFKNLNINKAFDSNPRIEPSIQLLHLIGRSRHQSVVISVFDIGLQPQSRLGTLPGATW